jgi:outer membrane translocation and assembly module TamA
MPIISRVWLFLALSPLPSLAQEGAAPTPGGVVADTLALPGVVEEETARGYEPALHGIRGFELGHVNRVDGYTPSLGLTLISVRPNALPTIDLSVGIRTNRIDRPRFRIALEQTFTALDRLRASAEYYHDTHTPDAWKVGARENDVWLFVFRRDLRHYYEADGARLSVSTSDLRPLGASLSLLTERNRSLEQDAFFTLTTVFGADEDFRLNPPVRDAHVSSVSFEARYLTAATQSPSLRVPGWNMAAAIERAGTLLDGDLTFTQGTLHVRRYTQLSERHWLAGRLYLSGPVAGTESLPEQRFTHLGGPGSLPGFDTLILAGDRGVLGSAEYSFQLPTTSWSAPIFLLWQLEVFTNAGNAVTLRERSRLYSDLRWDGGVGVSGVTVLGYLGLFIAQRLSHFDEPSSGPRVLFRLQRSF